MDDTKKNELLELKTKLIKDIKNWEPSEGDKPDCFTMLHNYGIELLEKYSLYLEDQGYLDADWRVEPPFAIELHKHSGELKKELDTLSEEFHVLTIGKDELFDIVKELKDFAIWMTGCGYDFTQHDYFLQKRDELLK